MTGHMFFRGLALTLTAQPPRKTRRKGNEEEEEKDGPLTGGKIGRNYPKEPGVSSPGFLPPLGSLLPPAGHSPGGWWILQEEPIAPDPPGLHQRVLSPLPSPLSCSCHGLHPSLSTPYLASRHQSAFPLASCSLCISSKKTV